MRMSRALGLTVILACLAGCGALSGLSAVPAGVTLHSGQTTPFHVTPIDATGVDLCNLDVTWTVRDPSAGTFPAPGHGLIPTPVAGTPCVGTLKPMFTASVVDQDTSTSVDFRCDPAGIGDESATSTVTVRPPITNSLPPGTVVSAGSMREDWFRITPQVASQKWTYTVEALDEDVRPNDL